MQRQIQKTDIDYRLLGKVQYKLAHHEASQDAYQRAQATAPQQLHAWKGLAELHTATGNAEQALQAYERLVGDEMLPRSSAGCVVTNPCLLKAATWSWMSQTVFAAVLQQCLCETCAKFCRAGSLVRRNRACREAAGVHSQDA